MFPLFTGPHGRHGRSASRILAAALALAAIASVSAADPGLADGTAGRTSDVLLARSALAALDADPQLRDVNLVVSVVDRVAVIGGPVPTADTGTRAEHLVRRVPGIADVKNRCFVQAGPDPLIRAVRDRVNPTARRPAADLPGLVPPPRPGPTVDTTAGPGDAAVAAADPGGKPVVVRRPANPAEGVLLAPVGPVGPGALVPPAAPPAVPLAIPPPALGTLTATPPVPTPATVPGRPHDMLAAADAVRKADPRFAGLTVEWRDGVLLIGGTAGRVADAWDLAQALRRVPGVSRVVVGSVEVK